MIAPDTAAPSIEAAAPCVHCGFCLPACPTYDVLGTEMDSPRGRLHLMDALRGGRAQPTPELLGHLDACLGCRACESACPSGVPYGEHLEAIRADTAELPRAEGSASPWFRRALLRAAQAPPWGIHAGMLVTWWALQLAPRLTRAVAARLGPGALEGLELLAHRRPRRARLLARAQPETRPRRRVALLLGCLHRPLSGSLHEATQRLLVRAGCEVVVPPRQRCCGALHQHMGDAEAARHRVAALLDDLRGVGRLDHLVINAAGCGAHLKHAASLWPKEHPRHAEALKLQERSVDALELLDELGLPAPRREVRAEVAVHHPCHLIHGQGVAEEPLRLLRAIPGLKLRELRDADRCCGSAGVYNLLQPELAHRLRDEKVSACQASGAERILAANPGCEMQIACGLAAAGSGQRTAHPLELLDEAHRA